MATLPSIFGDDFWNDWFDFSYPTTDSSRRVYSKSNLMQTDIKEKAHSYELEMELPGYNKDDVTIELKDGYMSITASKNVNNDEKDEEGRYIRRERFSGNVSRRFYVGEDVDEKDIHAKFENGILHLDIPKEEPKPQVEDKKIVTIE